MVIGIINTTSFKVFIPQAGAAIQDYIEIHKGLS